ncbi:hypothetical protein ABMA28_007095 [Loxostege sticticalis]|uniref:NADH dehydrogenase [ubiquinone] flavoprotein 3, mitochondrial n=1 Tax=Loxostege sticticalis TaxID=481309 RepID=A0ABD0TPJ8_LOXSC
MSSLCRLGVKPMSLSGVYRQRSILTSLTKIIPHQQLIICYSSKSSDCGKCGGKSDKPDKSCSKSSGSGSDKKGKGDDVPCEPCSPCGPCYPCTPCEPCYPCTPCSPCPPCSPCSPCPPCPPCQPCTPCRPCQPCSSDEAPKKPPPDDNNPSAPSMYDLRKYGHSLPKSDVRLYFEALPPIPTGIFRNTDCEILGLGAGKCCMYKNPEYFCYHHMSYYDMHLAMRCYRKPSPKTGRKP